MASPIDQMMIRWHQIRIEKEKLWIVEHREILRACSDTFFLNCFQEQHSSGALSSPCAITKTPSIQFSLL